MQINGFKIGGFANIKDAHLEIGEINALIAPNGYGKSNVLHAIEFGIRFLTAEDTERQQMMRSRWLPINMNMQSQNFSFGITGSLEMEGEEFVFAYDYNFVWAKGGDEGRIISESLKIKRSIDQRFRQMINRQQTDECLIVPSASGRCNKPFVVSASQLALSAIARSSMMYLYSTAMQVFGIKIPNLETLDNPESYFSVGGGKGVGMLGGMTLSEYLYQLKQSDDDNYAILKDGLIQLLPNITEFTPEVVTLPDGQRKIYDVKIKERFCTQPTTILQLSSGSKRIIFLFTLCLSLIHI